MFSPLLDARRPAATVVAAAVMALVAHSAMYGPQAAMIAEPFTTRLRCSGESMGYQLAGIAGGGLAPVIAIHLLSEHAGT